MEQTKSAGSPAIPIGGIVVGVVLVIVAQFFLESLADTTDIWHWTQHAVIFVSGLIIGYGATMLYVRGQSAA
jgi:hypothetical protein